MRERAIRNAPIVTASPSASIATCSANHFASIAPLFPAPKHPQSTVSPSAYARIPTLRNSVSNGVAMSANQRVKIPVSNATPSKISLGGKILAIGCIQVSGTALNLNPPIWQTAATARGISTYPA